MATQVTTFNFTVEQIYEALRKQYYLPARKSIDSIRKVGCDEHLNWYTGVAITAHSKLITRKKT